VGVRADAWLLKYRSEFESYKAAASEIEVQIVDALKGHSLNVQLVETRAKSPDSVAEKIRRRQYGDPARQFDDLLGARVITLFDHSVEDAVTKLRGRFDVDDMRSINKTKALRLRQVGYRSHHLVLKARKTGLGTTADILKRTFVEVQVRSVLSHAWAEIEHSLRYKIGSGIPEELGRRFDALAGVLELADREFSGIEQATVELVVSKSMRYRNGSDLDEALSTIQLLAALKSNRPDMRTLGPHGLVLSIEDAFRFAKLLQDCGKSTVESLVASLTNNEVLGAIARYAELSDFPLDPDEASAIVAIGAVIGIEDRDLFESVEAFKDPHLSEALP